MLCSRIHVIRRAAVAPFVVLMLVVLLSFAALAVDLGYLQHATIQMQNAVDAAALAGASGLDTDEDAARKLAYTYGGRNAIAGARLQQAESAVEIGHWEAVSRTFTGSGLSDRFSPNAVRVTGKRGDISLYFAQIMGRRTGAVKKDAVALSESGQCLGVWGTEGIEGVGDMYTDSFDSRDGVYGPGNINANGDLCSGRHIDLRGSVEIHGDAMYANDSYIHTSGSAYEVWGAIDDHCCPVAIPGFDINDAIAANDNASIGMCENTSGGPQSPFSGSGWNLSLSGNCREITLGTPGVPSVYYFNSVDITGQGQLNIVGPTTIYLDGPADFSGGGVINTSQDPRDLRVYSTDTDFRLTGNAGFYGVVIAPQATIDLQGTGDYYGTLIGQTLESNGDSAIHVDEAMVFDVLGIDGAAPTLVK